MIKRLFALMLIACWGCAGVRIECGTPEPTVTAGTVYTSSQTNAVFYTFADGTGTVWEITYTPSQTFTCTGETLGENPEWVGATWHLEGTVGTDTTYTNAAGYSDLVCDAATPAWYIVGAVSAYVGFGLPADALSLTLDHNEPPGFYVHFSRPAAASTNALYTFPTP